MVALWLPLLFKGEGRCVLTLIQPDSTARLWSSKLSPLQWGKETFNKGWLVLILSARSPASIPPCQSCNSTSFYRLTYDLSASYSVLPLSPTIPLLSSNLLHHQHIFNKQDLSCVCYCQSVLSWHERQLRRETIISSVGTEDCSHVLSFMWDQTLAEKQMLS